ncbi:TIGR03364 family FAD-dependent oxidoreductase [Panacibacter ginsenosidivorans]|uniref:TIGR03364 family FAD-dependent oxidoreductase n=1 Tax=Panacibacter ginsenosidivorans TaxID=1813871 RepID=A0A5B8V794_9BACT|nr:TIGR03364 family FAD-dependent oxidoreductase [Panacibacter ginsenosidivorans]QEC67119.1 TIGR03364 family FAD-dependent oxidoreductase [Panacibacter ginsenosidivorans]
MAKKNAIVIGAGIVGLAMARSLAENGFAVTVFERNEKAVGASVRNFGMVWPIGQPVGKLYERALRSKAIWKKVCTEAGLWHNEVGSLHLAYNDLEWKVLQEIAEAEKAHRPIAAITANQALQKSEAVNPFELKGALWNEDEMIVESRVAIEKLPAYITEKYGIVFYFNTAINEINYPSVKSGKQTWQADLIYVCSGPDLETLYPEVFAANYFTKSKLQMMRLIMQPGGWRIGPSLCGGLSLIHYKGFQSAASLPALKEYYETTMPDYIKWGIHVMVSQNAEGELTIGDSHEYGLVFDPFDKVFINKLIIDYMQKFAVFKDWSIIQSWHGIYPKRTNGEVEFIHSPENGVTIVNGLGGNGMTLSFGLAEEVVTAI